MRNLVLLLCLFSIVPLMGNGPDINNYLEMVANGKLTEVKSQLPDLMVEYPDDAGVKLLLGVVIDDAYKALEIYKKIVANYPESDWADDAYWRIVQFYALKGEMNKAQYELNYFRTKYPHSPYIIPASEVVRIAQGINKTENGIVKAKNENAIGRENTPVIKEETKYEPEPMQDLSKESENHKIGMIIEKEEPVKTVSETIEEPQRIQIKKVSASTDDLAVNTSNHKVVRQRVQEQEEETSTPADILKAQKQIVAETDETDEPDIAEAVEVKETTKKLIVEPKEIGNTGYYGLQVGIFDNMDNANAEMKKFLRKRMRTEVKAKSIDEDTKYAVVIGNYSSLESANAAKIIVQQQCDCEPVVFEK